MKRALLLATTTGYQIRSFGEAARVVGASLAFVSDRCDQLEDPWWDRAIPVRFFDAERAEAAVVRACGGQAPDAVIAVGDRPAVLAARLHAAFNLAGNPPEAAVRSRNKLESRDALRRAGLLVPDFRLLSLDSAPQPLAQSVVYPAVLKPLALSGSRGVMRVDDEGGFVDAFIRLRALMRLPDIVVERDTLSAAALVETFVPGTEYAVEGVLTHGKFQPFAIFDKPDPLDGPFFEESIYVTPSRQPQGVQRQILDAVSAAATALGLRHGPVHAECRVNESGVYVLEVAARPIGGLCSKALRFARGDDAHVPPVSLEEVLLRHALGEDVRMFQRESCASAVMMIPIPQRGILRDVAGLDDARAVAGIDEVHITAKRDALLVPLPEGRSYLGFIFAHGNDAMTAERAIREAHARLRF